MAYNLQISNAAAAAAVAALAALANGGSIALYTGTQPANANTGLSGNTLLAQLSLSATAFTVSNNVATANAITSATAVATGTATWFRCYESNGSSVVFDGTVGTSGCDLNMNSTAISSGATVAISSLTFTLTEAGS